MLKKLKTHIYAIISSIVITFVLPVIPVKVADMLPQNGGMGGGIYFKTSFFSLWTLIKDDYFSGGFPYTEVNMQTFILNLLITLVVIYIIAVIIIKLFGK